MRATVDGPMVRALGVKFFRLHDLSIDLNNVSKLGFHGHGVWNLDVRRLVIRGAPAHAEGIRVEVHQKGETQLPYDVGVQHVNINNVDISNSTLKLLGKGKRAQVTTALLTTVRSAADGKIGPVTTYHFEECSDVYCLNCTAEGFTENGFLLDKVSHFFLTGDIERGGTNGINIKDAVSVVAFPNFSGFTGANKVTGSPRMGLILGRGYNATFWGKVNFETGISGDTGGLKHGRQSTGSIPPGTSRNVIVKWKTPFPDDNYTVQALVQDDAVGHNALRVHHVISRTVSAATFRVVNDAGRIARAGVLHVVAIHD